MILPRESHAIPLLDLTEVPHLGTIAFCICFVIAVCITAQKSFEKFGGSNKKVLAAYITVPTVSIILLMLRFGESMRTAKGLILVLLFLYASYSDIRTRKCGDLLHVFIILTAFIGIEISDLPQLLIAGAYILVFMLGTSVLFKERIGGADIKFSAACAFLLGAENGLLGLIVGLTAAVCINVVLRFIKHKDHHAGFPMIPYIAAGFFAAYFI